jgi:hypothetical protein
MSHRKVVTFAEGNLDRIPRRGMRKEECGRKRPSADMAELKHFQTESSSLTSDRVSQEIGIRDAELSFVPDESLVHAGDVGFAVTAFNLEDELFEGSIDDEAGFIPVSLRDRAGNSPDNSQSSSASDDVGRDQQSSDQETGGDAWLDHEEENARTAPAYQSRTDIVDFRPRAKRQRIHDEATVLSTSPIRTSQQSLLAELSEELLASETASGAIRRLKKVGELQKLERVTELCDGLLGRGVLGIYEMNRESVIGNLSWMLSWGLHGGSGDIHGPFSTTQLLSWSKAGYFSHPGKIGWVQVADADRPWHLASDEFL